tara:strand:+ start:205 stop:474 length:270 start_codon:yes stop_codon:yes gene_type:complete
MATNSTDLSPYAAEILEKASKLKLKADMMADSLLEGHASLVSLFMWDLRYCMDDIASAARKLSNEYLDKHMAENIFKPFENYQHDGGDN